jgi:hypothetical protein
MDRMAFCSRSICKLRVFQAPDSNPQKKKSTQIKLLKRPKHFGRPLAFSGTSRLSFRFLRSGRSNERPPFCYLVSCRSFLSIHSYLTLSSGTIYSKDMVPAPSSDTRLWTRPIIASTRPRPRISPVIYFSALRTAQRVTILTNDYLRDCAIGAILPSGGFSESVCTKSSRSSVRLAILSIIELVERKALRFTTACSVVANMLSL